MKIAIGCDQAGFILKPEIMEYLNKNGHEVLDFGVFSEESVDYSDYAEKAGRAVQNGEADFGILMCGTGVGISIAANKMKGIRCALLSDTFTAHATREHNDTNMMALGGRVVGSGLAVDIVDVFLNTPFSGEERHQRRIDKVMAIENKNK